MCGSNDEWIVEFTVRICQCIMRWSVIAMEIIKGVMSGICPE